MQQDNCLGIQRACITYFCIHISLVHFLFFRFFSCLVFTFKHNVGTNLIFAQILVLCSHGKNKLSKIGLTLIIYTLTHDTISSLKLWEMKLKEDLFF